MVSRYRRCNREAFQSPLETELQAIQPSPYRAGLAEPNLQRLPVASASTACFCPVGLSPAGLFVPNTLLSVKGINYAPDTAHHQMKAVGHLYRARGTTRDCLAIRAAAITGDDLDACMGFQPGRQSRRRAIRQQLDRP